MKIFSSVQKKEYIKYKFLGLTLFKRRSLSYVRQRELAYLANLVSVQQLHARVFPPYKNALSGKDVVLIATGPSLKDFQPMEDAVYVGVNRAYAYDKVRFSYLFLQDYSGSRDYLEALCSYPQATKFLGISPEYYYAGNVIPDYVSSYPGVERYYVAHPEEKFNFTYDLATQPMGDSYSIVFPAMQFILWAHPKRIFLVGCDSTTGGYYNAKHNRLEVDKVKMGWVKMRDFIHAYYPDVEVISINPVGLKGLFRDVYEPS